MYGVNGDGLPVAQALMYNPSMGQPVMGQPVYGYPLAGPTYALPPGVVGNEGPAASGSSTARPSVVHNPEAAFNPVKL